MSVNRLGYLDAKREEFRRYLEESGVMDAFTKVLVSLYEEPEKPKDALEYVVKNLGEGRPEIVEFESMKAELEEYKARMKLLESENEELRKTTGDLEPQVALDDMETGKSTSLLEPERTESQLEAERTSSILEPGRSASQSQPGRSASQSQPGRSASQSQPGRTASQSQPGRTASQSQPGRTASQSQPGRTASQSQPGRTPSLLESQLEQEQEEMINQ